MRTIARIKPRTWNLLAGLCLAAGVAGLSGCASGGGAGSTTSDDAASKSNFTRPATDAEKAKANNAPPK